MTRVRHVVWTKGFHERFHVDPKGRRWSFVQRDGPDPTAAIAASLPLVWVCEACGGTEPVLYDVVVHDSVNVDVGATDVQLEAHDCDVFRVRQVHES